ncbi:MAG: hypothetical protein KDG89_14500 [Geminicoccaceae bacterium]|nr:hypothetical protein [Geminicoccaceae bacterium]
MERQAAGLRQSLAHLDGAIRVFDPGYRLETIRPKRQRHPCLFENGELVRAVLDALRTAQGPLSASAIAGAVIRAKGLPDDRPTRLLVERRVDRTVRRKGDVVERVALDGRAVAWRVRA